MNWKLPLVFCIFLIGSSICQTDGTTDSNDDSQSDITTAAADEAVASTNAGAEDAADAADASTAETAGEESSSAAAAVVEPPTTKPSLGVDPGGEQEEPPATQIPATDKTAEEATTAADAAEPALTVAPSKAPPDAPTSAAPAAAPASSAAPPDEPAAVSSTAQPATEEPQTAQETTAPTLPGAPGEQEGPQGGGTPKAETETTEADEVTTAEPATTTTPAPETTSAPWSGEPCETPHILDAVERHFTATVGNVPVNDRKLKKTWYQFEYDKMPAIITSQPIKPEQCGTHVPFHLSLEGKKLPEKDSNGTYKICSSVNSEYGLIPCAEPQDVVVKNCGDKYVYQISPLIWTASLKAQAGICIQRPGDIVSLHYLAISQEESDKLDVPVTSVDDVSQEQLEGIVTVELAYPKDLGGETDTEFLRKKDKKYRPMVAQALNGLPKPTEAPQEDEPTTAANKVEETKEEVVAGQPPAPDAGVAAPEPEGRKPPNNLDTDADGKGPRAAPLVANPRFLFKRDLSRVKRDSDHQYTEDDVHYVGPTPRIKRNVLQKSIYVDDPETTAVDGNRLLAAVKSLNQTGQLGNELNLTVLDIYLGLPRDIKPLVPPVTAQSTWKRHEGVFITIIVLLLLLLLILLIGICCIKCRKRRGSWTANERPKGKGKKSPSKKPLTAHESPLHDDEIKKDENNMTERENPAYTANGSGGHIAKPSKDDEQGWIVPFEELSRAERNQPDVHDTKL